ncbi:MAG: hypothetical protein APG12_01549 [Candidatus Methanofastidiosum methylothiophilum]|uniref:Uncharacterized protein n=1 Tax=Candidatus Methanofastidiosum methylothiophilum TaxID=1705564 RepID=A0A150IJ37_9EURY|nr:MAG: hypothetical protein APG10_01375 [Candidatus Methanofastidiosum methylthiophilus]KYC49353.1 MAG: hypothetical protein APG12_01549 [Candidatus Methanofastidiosum methylthiophilus]
MSEKNKKVNDIINNLITELQEFEDSVKQCDTYSHDLKEILEITSEIGSSWSGSWLGYHADLYYTNFQRPPMRFDADSGLSLRRQRGWEAKTYDDIVRFINHRYNGPTLEEIESSLDNIILKNDLPDKLCSDLSFIRNIDKLRSEVEILDKIENITWQIPASNLINEWMPKGRYLTSDIEAVSQGIRTAPHISCRARVSSLRSIPYQANNFIKWSKKLIGQIETKISIDENLLQDTKIIENSSIENSSNNKDFRNKVYVVIGVSTVCFGAIGVINTTEFVKQFFSFDPQLLSNIAIVLFFTPFIVAGALVVYWSITEISKRLRN